jgi:amino acid adenylation domain-containing protein
MKDILGFHHSAERFPDRTALEIDDHSYSYAELLTYVKRLSMCITPETGNNRNDFIGIFAERSLITYSGILSVLSSKKAYVPLNPKYPSDRLATIIQRAGLRRILLGEEAFPILDQLLPLLPAGIEWVTLDMDVQGLRIRFPKSRFIPAPSHDEASHLFTDHEYGNDDYAYLIFTSGSTGIPKGVGVTYGNLNGYIKNQLARYDLNETDRFSQTADISFDLSIHDFALTWQKGSCCCVVPQSSLIAPGRFIRSKQITSWCSVPSVGLFMDKLKMLQPGLYPKLRYIVFCGEPLPADITQKWAAAAPEAIIDNLYGPTEATCAITYYRWDRQRSLPECEHGVVPIGKPFVDQQVALYNPETKTVLQGEAEGELCLAGSQVTKGYYNDAEKTQNSYIRLPHSDKLWYRTGDLVKRRLDGELLYVSRIDNLVKLRGYRIELQEIEWVLNQASGGGQAICIAIFKTVGIAEKIIAFIADKSKKNTVESIITFCESKLPDYMVPSEVIFIDAMPVNMNGKFDRKRLLELYKSGGHQSGHQ